METCFEDVRQDEEHVPNLLEAIIQPKLIVKDALRQQLFKMSQFGFKISKIKIPTFWIPEIQSIPAEGQHNLLAQ